MYFTSNRNYSIQSQFGVLWGAVLLVKVFLPLFLCMVVLGMEYEKYVKLGKEIGLSGQGLLDFANNREAIDKKNVQNSKKRHVKKKTNNANMRKI